LQKSKLGEVKIEIAKLIKKHVHQRQGIEEGRGIFDEREGFDWRLQ